MRGQIVAVANQKGGVGKTTLAVHLAAWLAREGMRAVIADGDPQGNASSWLLGGDVSDGGMFRLLYGNESLARVVRGVNGQWGVGLLPGNEQTSDALALLTMRGRPFDTVARRLRPLKELVDYVLVDMPPSKSVGFREMLFAADWVLVPTQLERLSLEGVGFVARTCVALARDHGRGPRLLGVVPNMVRLQTLEHREHLEEVLEELGEAVWPAIPESIRVAEACNFGETLYTHAPGEGVTRAMTLVAIRFLENTQGGSNGQ